MGELGPSKRLALDANLPLDLAADFDFAHDFRQDFQARGYSLLLPPTAAEEIWLIHAITIIRNNVWLPKLSGA